MSLYVNQPLYVPMLSLSQVIFEIDAKCWNLQSQYYEHLQISKRLTIRGTNDIIRKINLVRVSIFFEIYTKCWNLQLEI